MAQTAEGALKVAAQKAGLSTDAYREQVAAGLKWCYECRGWIPRDLFAKDSSRSDGLVPVCKPCRNGPGTKAEKISRALRDRQSTFKGRSHTPEAKALMRTARLGKPGPFKGQKRDTETRKKISASVSAIVARGPDHYAYSHGGFQRSLNDRRRAEYRWWREAVFRRDGFTCRHCGDSRGGNLEAHHVEGFAENELTRFDVDNGLTLCEPCHDIVHYGRPKASAGKRNTRKRRQRLSA